MSRDEKSRTGAKEGTARGTAGAPSRGLRLAKRLRGLFGRRRSEELAPAPPDRGRAPGEPGAGAGGARAAESGSREPLYTGDRDERIDTRELPGPGASEGSWSDEHAGGVAGSARAEQRTRRSGAGVDARQAKKPSRASSRSRASDARRTGASGTRGAGRNRPTDEGARATSGRSESPRAAKKAARRKRSTGGGASASSRQQPGTTREGTRTASSAGRGTSKGGMRGGSSKSRSARRATSR